MKTITIKTQKEFDKIGIHAERFDAISNIQGHIGCMLSHISVIEKCRGIKRFSIFEDDVCFVNNAKKILTAVKHQLPHNWDMLYLGAYLQSPIKKENTNLYKLTDAYSAHAIIFNNIELTEYIISNKEEIYEHQKIDEFYKNVIQPIYNVYLVSPCIATQRNTYSDITRKNNEYYELIIDSQKKYAT